MMNKTVVVLIPLLLAPLVAAYNAGAAVAWANQYCGQDDQWLCAEYVCYAMQNGGEPIPHTVWVHDIVNYMNANGWSNVGSDCCGPPGAIVVYGNNDHVAISVGGGLIDQHNPLRCSHSGDWTISGLRTVYVKSGAANETVSEIIDAITDDAANMTVPIRARSVKKHHRRP